MKVAVVLAMMFVAGCDGLPRDPSQTLKHIEQERIFDVGLVARTPKLPIAQALISEVERQTHAHARMHEGSADQLFGDLEAGKLDLVVGAFSKESPWESKVTFGPTLSTLPASMSQLELKAVMRNGENRWIMLVEGASRAISTEARDK